MLGDGPQMVPRGFTVSLHLPHLVFELIEVHLGATRHGSDLRVKIGRVRELVDHYATDVVQQRVLVDRISYICHLG